MTEEASGGRAGSCDVGNVTPRKGPRWLEKCKLFSPMDGTGWIAGKGRWLSSNHRRGGLPEDHGQGWFQFEVGGLDFARVTTHITEVFELYTLKKSRKGKAS